MIAPDAATPPVRLFDDIRIGVHLKDLRPNVDGPGTVRMLLDSADRLRRDGVPAVAEVRLHHRVRDEAAREEVRHLCAADEHATLVEHERLSDAELAIALSRLDVYVLPYRHGTHSGWLEFCWDLGVPVAVPLVGYYAEQHPDGSVATFAPGSGADLSAALARLLSGSDVVRAGTAERADIVAARREARRRTDAAAAAAHAGALPSPARRVGPLSAREPLRIVVIAPLRFPIRPPHPGGLESAVWSEVAALTRRGHDVRMVAVRGSDFVEPGARSSCRI